MEIGTTIWIPTHVYKLYDDIATRLGNISTEQVMSAALTAYAEIMMEEGKERFNPGNTPPL